MKNVGALIGGEGYEAILDMQGGGVDACQRRDTIDEQDQENLGISEEREQTI